MDAEFYQAKYVEVEQILRSGSWQHLRDLVEPPVKGVQPEYDPKGTVPAVTVTSIDPNRIDVMLASKVSVTFASTNLRARANPGEVLITVTGPPLGEAAVVRRHHCPLVISSHVARLRPKSSFQYASYLAAVLNSPIGSSQVYRHCKGIRQKELYPDDLLNFVIPSLDLDIVIAIDTLGHVADFMEYEASKLVDEAKVNVESLIAGELEIDAIAAGRIVPPTWEDVLTDVEASLHS
jgi:hypothetical protein